ncbi:MAG: hypothetical protein MHMPM18_004304 [Marteilia pararefringens]
MNKTENSAGGPDSSLAHSADTQGVNDETNIANKNSTDATGGDNSIFYTLEYQKLQNNCLHSIFVHF